MTRLIKTAMPDNFLIHADVKATVIKSTSLFMMYLTDAANDIRKQTKRSTITAEDVIAALKDVDFECLIEPVTAFCTLTRAQNKEKRDAIKARKTARKEDGDGDDEAGSDGEADAADAGGDAKRAKSAPTAADDDDEEEDADVQLTNAD
jgi:DNA polymerase epsilon subunit 3